MIVVWPLLAYRDIDPIGSSIVFCNLIADEPQKVVSIYPFTFVKFIDMGMNSERIFFKKNLKE
jgi:hypothetical protein